MNFSYHTGHVLSDHTHKTHPSDCFKCCEHCSGWQAEQFCQPTSLGSDKDKIEERSTGSICYNYHAPVTNNYYTLPTTATPTCSSSSHPNSNDEKENPLNSPSQCPNVEADRDIGSHVLLMKSSDKKSCGLHKRSRDLNHKNGSKNSSKHENGRARTVLSRKATFIATNDSADLVHTPPPPPQCARSLSDSSLTLKQRCCARHEQCSCEGKPLTVVLTSLPSGEGSTSRSPASSEDTGAELTEMANRLFDVFPYNFLRGNYHGTRKEILRSLLVVLFIYQALSAGLMTICENGGLRAVFHSGDQNQYPEIINRLLKFSLRLMFRTILPICCTLHLPILATVPHIPATNLSRQDMVAGLMRVHNCFSSEEEVAQLRNGSPRTVLSMSEEMAKRRIHSVWITATHSLLYTFLLVYLGAFYVCEQNTMKGGVCNFLSVTIIHVPWLNFNFHFVIAAESFTIFLNFLILGIVGDCYHYENRIATYATIIGGDAKILFKEVRRRWVVMDTLVYVTPLVKAAILAISISTGRPFVSTPVSPVQDSDLADWYFWIMVLTVLFGLGTSSTRMAKKACIIGYVIAAMLIFAVQVETSHIPYGSIMVLVYTAMCVYVLNHLFGLARCYYSNISSCSGWFPFLMIMCLILILMVSVTVTIYREIALFSLFVVW